MKYCGNCGAASEDKAKFCYNCGEGLKDPLGEDVKTCEEQSYKDKKDENMRPYNYEESSISSGLKLILYIFSFFLPPIGIIIGIIYLNENSEEKKKFGKGILIFSIIWMALLIILTIIAFIAFAGFFSYDMHYYY